MCVSLLQELRSDSYSLDYNKKKLNLEVNESFHCFMVQS